MADLTTLQINGTPILMYGLVGITTAVLAYATAGGEFGKFASKTMGELSTNSLIGTVSSPAAELGNLNPFSSKTDEAKEESTAPPAEEEAPPPPAEEEAPPPPTEGESSMQVETGEETKGGKKSNRKTPRRKSTKRRKTKTRRAKKQKKRDAV